MIKEGDVFGRLTVLSIFRNKIGNQGRKTKYALCECECGNKKKILAWSLSGGSTKSCGCIKMKHGKTNTPEFSIWSGMVKRCKSKNNPSYSNYGGRGIAFCDRWKDFVNFLEDMGERPKGMTLDRIDVNGNYCKENCRWTTWVIQQNNKRNNRVIKLGGKEKTITEWSRETGIKKTTIKERLNRGYSDYDALTMVVAPYKFKRR